MLYLYSVLQSMKGSRLIKSPRLHSNLLLNQPFPVEIIWNLDQTMEEKFLDKDINKVMFLLHKSLNISV